MLAELRHPAHVVLAAALAVALALGACSSQPAAPSGDDPDLAPTAPPAASPAPSEPAAPAEVDHLTTPVRFRAAVLQQILDCNTGRRAGAGVRLELNPTCDRWNAGEVERPMDASGEAYLPWLDILRVEFGADDLWHYARIQTAAADDAAARPDRTYAIEIDLDLDGRGDLLIVAQRPNRADDDAWSVAGVQVWLDENHDVGGPILAARDEGATGDGFERLIFDQGRGDDPDLAWARLAPDAPGVVEIAFKQELLGGAPAFAWWAWAAASIDPAVFDFVDAFGPDELYALDNTCAWIYGRTTQTVPNRCPAISDPPTPTSPAPAGACAPPPEGCAAKYGDPCYLWIQQWCECVCFN